MPLIAKFENLPMPPTVNNSYENGGKRRIKSDKLRAYQLEMHKWGLFHVKELRQIHEAIEANPFKKLRLNLVFHFPREKIYTKSGNVKERDTSNLIKAIEDAFFNLIGIDDRFVFKVEAEKREAEIESASLQIHFFEP